MSDFNVYLGRQRGEGKRIHFVHVFFNKQQLLLLCEMFPCIDTARKCLKLVLFVGDWLSPPFPASCLPKYVYFDVTYVINAPRLSIFAYWRRWTVGRPGNKTGMNMLGLWMHITMVLCLTSVMTDMKHCSDYIPIIIRV